MDSTMNNATTTTRQRKTMRRPLKYVAAAICLTALPVASLTMRKSNVSTPNVSGSSRDLSEFMPSSRRTQSTLPSSAKAPNGSVLKMICDERQEFEVNLGKAVDTLKHDYPDILTEPPDFSVYHPELEVVDPSGVKIHGVKNYKNAFRLVHTVVNLFYCPERSLLTFRLIYDWARNEIRVSWNAEVVPKAIFGGTKTTLHIDGISVYAFDKASGKIIQHRVEHLLINDSPVAPERGIIHALQKKVAIEPDISIPVCYNGNENTGGNQVVEFQPFNPLMGSWSRPSSLFSMSSSMSNGNSGDAVEVDWEALEKKNASRKKFGLEPLTPEEFKEIEAQVRAMDAKQQERAARMSSATELPKEKKGGFLDKLFGDVLEDTCESNYDCQRPEVCCDFGFTKKCCSSGMLVGDSQGFGNRAVVPVVAGYPPGMGQDDDMPIPY
jgi:hypothetical protein